MPVPTWPPRGYVTVPQAAADLGVSTALVRRLVPTLPEDERVQTGRAWLIRTRAVERLRRRPTQRGRPVGWRKPQRTREE